MENDYSDILDVGVDSKSIDTLVRCYYVINATSEFDSEEGVNALTKGVHLGDKYIDSKLCDGGKQKASKIYEDWFKKKGFTPKNSVAISSQLRCAFGTALLGTSGEHLKIFINQRLNEIKSSKNSTPSSDLSALKKYAKELNCEDADFCVHEFSESPGPVRHVEFYKNIVQTRCEDEFGAFWSYVIDHEVLDILKEKEKNLLIFGHQEWFKHFSATFGDCSRWFYTSSVSLPNCTIIKFDIVIKKNGNMAFGTPTIDYMQEPLKNCGIHHKFERGLRHVKKHTLKAPNKVNGFLKNIKKGITDEIYDGTISAEPSVD